MSVVRIVTRILPSGAEPQSAPHLLDPGEVGEPLDREWSRGESFVAETTFCKENALPAGADPDRAAALPHGVSGLVCLKKSRLRLTTEVAEQPRRRPLVRISHGTCGGILLSIPLRISRGDLQPLPPPRKEFLCEVCGKGFRNRGVFRRHRRGHAEAHPLERFLKDGRCLLCGFAFDSRSEEAIRSHLNTHLSRDQFEQLEGLLSAHRARKRFLCDVCGRGFNQQGAFWRHCALHRGDPAFRCSICRKAFTTKTALAAHKRSHFRQAHRCGACGMRFKSPVLLRNHVVKNHPEVPDL